MKIDKSISDLTFADVLTVEVGTEIECADGFALLTSKSKARHIPERRHTHPELLRQINMAGDYEVIAPAVDVIIPASVEGVFDVEIMTDELRKLRNRPGPDELQEQIDFIRWVVDGEVPVAVEVPAPVVEPEPPAEPYVPDFTLIPGALAKYAEADESAEDFRLRLKSYFQRFGIDEGKNFPGGGEPLTGDEKIQMREIDIMLNSDTGKAARLHDWLFAD